MSARKIAILIALIAGYCVFVFALASTLMAQRYEYRATPIETGPITVPCFVVDRFNYLCIETGEIFVDVAGAAGVEPASPRSKRGILAIERRAQDVAAGRSARLSHAPARLERAALGAFPHKIANRRAAAATPSIIYDPPYIATEIYVLAHKKVNVAGLSADPYSARRHRKMAGDQAPFSNIRVSLHAAATPSIILAHQKIASDAWTLTAQDRDAFQQWIHDNRPACCDHRDCKPARVEWTPNGWRVEGADNLIAERDVIAWPFAVPYACIINRYARCLFLNSGG